MPFTRTLLALSLGMALLQNPAFAAPPLSMTDGVAHGSEQTRRSTCAVRQVQLLVQRLLYA